MNRLSRLLSLSLALTLSSPLATRAQHNITTFAGGGPNNVPAVTNPPLSPAIGGPAGAVKDSVGNLYILDNAASRVFKVDTTGKLTLFAGNGTSGFSGDTGPATNAQLNGPSAILLDSAGNVLIADNNNGVIRKVAAGTGIITTIAGTPLTNDFGGDGGPATSAKLNHPHGISIDGSGNLFISDNANAVIRKVTAGTISTIAGKVPTNGVPSPGFSGDGGPATAAQLNGPEGIYVDALGNLFIADKGNNAIRKVAAGTGIITTVAGTPPTRGYNGDGILATTAKLDTPAGVFVDGANNLFIADNNNNVIREVTAVDGKINSVAGMPGHYGWTGDGGPATQATLGHPTNIFLDGAHNLFIADPNSAEIREVAGTPPPAGLTTGNIYTIAGDNKLYWGGDGGAANQAEIGFPAGVAVDGSGNTYISDSGSVVIRKVAVGTISTIAGVPDAAGYGGDGGPATAAFFSLSFQTTIAGDVAVDKSGNIFVADTLNCLVRKFTVGGNIVTVAGTAPNPSTNPPSCGFSGEGGPATSAQLNHPYGIAVDGQGNLFIADSDNHAIREVPAVDGNGMTHGNIYTVAGFPQDAQPAGYNGDNQPAVGAKLNHPQGVFVDGFGNLFIADTNNHIVREVSALTGSTLVKGNIYRLAGTPQTAGFGGDTGLATAPGALLNQPWGVTVDTAGNLFIADSANQIIREVTVADGKINTVAGTPQMSGYSGDGADAKLAKLYTPAGITFDGSGNLLVADRDTSRIRSVASLAGANPGIRYAPSGLTFGVQAVGIASASQPVVVINTGSGPLAISVSATGANPGDFVIARDNCSPSIAANSSCTINVGFKPTASGTRNGILQLTDGAAGNPQQITLTGTGGVPTADLSGTTLTFSTTQPVGTTSAVQTVTLTNNGTVPLAVTSIQITGTNSGDFAQSNTCGTSVPAGINCTISVTFTPGASGGRTASITITDNATPNTQTITLTGTGVATGPGLSSTSLSFTTQIVGVTSTTAQTVTLTNNGTSPLNVTSIMVTGSNASDFAQTNTCGTSVAAGKNCTISVTFTPSSSGNRTASITITDNAAGSPQSVSLSGMGLALSLGVAANGSATQAVKAGQTATYNLQLSATGGTATDQISVTIGCMGAPSLSTCNPPASPVVVTPAAAAPFSVSVTTTAATILVPGPQSEPRMQLRAMPTLPLVVLALLVIIAALLAWTQTPAGLSRTLRMAFSACLVLLPVSAATLLTGCASSGGGGNSVVHTPGTAAGSYALTVTATASGKTQSTQLTLVVQ